jgi:hypothetical protein
MTKQHTVSRDSSINSSRATLLAQYVGNSCGGPITLRSCCTPNTTEESAIAAMLTSTEQQAQAVVSTLHLQACCTAEAQRNQPSSSRLETTHLVPSCRKGHCTDWCCCFKRLH